MYKSIMIDQVGGSDVLKSVAIEPPKPLRGQVLVRNHAAAVNFIDTIIRRGAMPAEAMPSLPHTPGVEGAGIVEAVGSDVAGFVPGDRVAWMGPVGAGGYGSFSVLSPHSLVAIPREVGFDIAAALPVNTMTAWQLLVKVGRVEPGDKVLIRAAAGGVGTMLVQLAKHLGATVIAVCSTPKLDFVRSLGADYVLSHETDNIAQQVTRLTEGKGVDLSCNPVSGRTIVEDMTCLAPFGRVLIFGFLGGQPEGAFSPDLTQHFAKSISIHVSDIYTLYSGHRATFSAALRDMINLHAKGILRPKIHSRFGLNDAGKAHKLLEQGSVMGKVILTIP